MMILNSPAFQDDGQIPQKYTCDGAPAEMIAGRVLKDVSPPLAWSNVPAQAKSLVLIVDDPDATDEFDEPLSEPRVHWVLYNIPPSASALPEGVIISEDQPEAREGHELPAGTLEGVNGWELTGYRGPCPPSGRHHYFFRLYALDIEFPDLRRPSEAKIWEQVRRWPGGPSRVIAWAELVGTYQRVPPRLRYRE